MWKRLSPVNGTPPDDDVDDDDDDDSLKLLSFFVFLKLFMRY